MTSQNLKKEIKRIAQANSSPIVYALLKDKESYKLKQINLPNNSSLIKQNIEGILNKYFLSPNVKFEIKTPSSDKKDSNTYFEVIRNKNYHGFDFLDNIDTQNYYNEDELKNLKGIFLRISLDDDYLWIYQKLYNYALIKKQKSDFLIKKEGNHYKAVSENIIKVDERLDILILNKSIITSNITLLQNDFNYKEYVQAEAKKTLKTIKNLNILDNTKTLEKYIDGEQITSAKKMMRAANSKVLKLDKKVLFERIKKSTYYKDKIKFNKEKDKILVTNRYDVRYFLRLINDEVLYSEILREYVNLGEEL